MFTVKIKHSREETIRRELEKIRLKRADKKLRAEDVIKAARSKTHPLHGEFLWDDAAAGHQYRLVQAREIIRTVKIDNPGDIEHRPAPRYVSLQEDRNQPGGGYVEINDLANDEIRLEQLEQQARNELEAWTNRYAILTALVSAVKKAAGQARKSGRKKGRVA